MSAAGRCGYHRGATYGPRCTLEAGHAGAHAWEERRPWAAPDPMAEGAPAADFEGHPDVNARQRRFVAAAVRTDPGARILGMDENERPVVRFRAGMPREPRTVAVLKNGETTDPGRIREGWAK